MINFNRLNTFLGYNITYLIGGSFWLTFMQAINAGGGFILSLVYARFLSPLILGQYLFVMSFISLFSNLAHPGMSTTIIRAISQGRETIFKAATRETFPWAIAAGLPLVIISAYYAFKWPTDLTLAKTFIIAFFLCIPLWSFRFFDSYFLGKKQYAYLFFFSTIILILTLISMAAVIFYFPSIFALVTVNLSTQSFFFVSISLYIFRKLKKTKLILTDFKLANKLNLIRLIASFTLVIDKIIIGKFLGFEAVALYTFIQIIPEQIKSFLKNIASLTLPEFSHSALNGKKKIFFAALGQYFLLSIGLTVGYILLAPYLFRWFFPAYSQGTPLSQIYAISLITMPTLIASSLFESQADLKALRFQNYGQYLPQLLLLALLTWKFGLIGTIVAVIIGRFLAFFISLYLLVRTDHFD